MAKRPADHRPFDCGMFGHATAAHYRCCQRGCRMFKAPGVPTNQLWLCAEHLGVPQSAQGVNIGDLIIGASQQPPSAAEGSPRHIGG